MPQASELERQVYPEFDERVQEKLKEMQKTISELEYVSDCVSQTVHRNAL